MDDKIKKLAKFNRENPGVLETMDENCPSEYGLIDYTDNHCNICDVDCIYCWEQALKAVHDE